MWCVSSPPSSTPDYCWPLWMRIAAVSLQSFAVRCPLGLELLPPNSRYSGLSETVDWSRSMRSSLVDKIVPVELLILALYRYGGTCTRSSAKQGNNNNNVYCPKSLTINFYAVEGPSIVLAAASILTRASEFWRTNGPVDPVLWRHAFFFSWFCYMYS